MVPLKTEMQLLSPSHHTILLMNRLLLFHFTLWDVFTRLQTLAN